MQEDTESSLGYDFYDAKPSLKNIQSQGYAEVYARNNEEHYKHEPFVFDPPTIEEMETARSAASRDENGDLCIRGITHQVDLASSDLGYKATVFRPDANGEKFYFEPVYEDGELIDIIWSTIDLGEWGFTTGRGAVLGAENLSKTYTAELPLHVYDNPQKYWEHFEECEDGSHNEDAVCILKLSGRALLPAVGHVQVFYWDDVEDLAEGFFAECPERVSAFQDQEAFDAFVKRAALWERFDDMQPAALAAGSCLTWAHAKAAIKARRKTNAETGLNGFEEFRARVKAHAARPEVSTAVSAWRDDPSDGNELIAQQACMPFHLRDIVFQARLDAVDEWKRLYGELLAKPETERSAGRLKREPMFQRVGKLKARSRQWLIQGLIARNEVGNPFGRPDSFKGVSAAQLVAHIAGGVEFLGLQVKQAPTGYFAAERGEQVKIRIKGHIHRLGLPEDLPCYFGDRPINLLDEKDVQFLLEEIEMMELDAGRPLGFLVIDTQSRTLDGDENTTKDGAKYAKAIEIIRKKTSATLWIISHTGHAESAQDRPRGNSSLLGAYDTFYRHVKKDEKHGLIKITLDRDGLGQREFHFVVNLHDTGLVNDDGESVLVPYLESAAAPAKFTFKKGDKQSKPTPGETLMLKAVRVAIRKSDRKVGAEDASGDLLEGARYVTGAEWREEFRTLYKTGSSRQAESQAFAKGLAGVIAKGFVGARGQCYWPTITAPC